KELGLESTEKEKLFSVAKRACAPNGPIHNMPFPIDSGMVYKAILSTDKLGRKIKRKKSKSARKCEKLKYLQ
ncbi:MAG: hypothetical protein ACETVN_04335, partial [Asgard group archaeon]